MLNYVQNHTVSTGVHWTISVSSSTEYLNLIVSFHDGGTLQPLPFEPWTSKLKFEGTTLSLCVHRVCTL